MTETTHRLSTNASISLQMMEGAAADRTAALGIVRPLARRSAVRLKPEETEVAVIVEAGKGKALAALLKKAKAVRSVHLGGDFYTAVVPLKSARVLYEHAAVRYVEALKQKRTLLEKALVEGAVGLPANRAVVGEGEGVVVGIIDSGFDLSHPVFRDSAGQLRVDALLVQSFNETTGRFSTREFSAAQLVAGWRPGGARPGADEDGHGTHVASIAAGSRFNNLSGVAPKARFVLVKTDFIRLADATKWCFDKAGDRPAVVNMSLGGHHGGHDGASREERALEQMSGPGRIVVLAAGNEREDNIHIGARFAPGQTETATVDISTDERALTVVCYFDHNDGFDVALVSPSGLVMAAPSGNAVKTFAANGAKISIGRKAQAQAGAIEVMVDVAFRRGTDLSELKGWKLRVTCSSAEQGRFDAWITGNSAFRSGSFVETARTIGMPATAERVIAVASHVTKNRWLSDAGGRTAPGAVVGRSSRFSSRGPTRDGREKPEVSAPGEMITAALAANSESAADEERAHTATRTLTIEGTSMATPFVTGVIALMLQQRPQLESGQIVDAIRETAIKDANTGPANWTPEYGHGKISAKALVDHVTRAVRAVVAGRAPRRAAPTAAARRAAAPATGRPGRKVAAKRARTAVRRAGKRARS